MLEEMENVQAADKNMPTLKGIRDEDINSDDVTNHLENAEFMKRINDIDIDKMNNNNSKKIQINS